MSGWQLFWSIVFFVAVGIFAVLAVVVSIGGARDVKKMLDSLRKNDSSTSD
mgnify:CR=1 FL=1